MIFPGPAVNHRLKFVAARLSRTVSDELAKKSSLSLKISLSKVLQASN